MTMRKTYKANPPKPAAPALPRDDKRTFDMRPKPTNDRRDDPRYRPPQHVDPVLDDPEADGAPED